ncbi:hypothetical protein KM176_17185 [Pseudooceanicola sp. CBS1P-1]|uniref:Chemotaxis protein CheA n=1 Tax=Pseudooceanicola albus TaxID=2692189 RepID=A0A6L7G4P9_9RHOB|nr:MULTISPECIES: hypothetical protein [Pseudooceanicola]MBT9385609.1 hypothetical protein [Pseudooceanicola endophyticus]MXN18981.1 hypothetical protein [Pseudooceanicola albus]
MADQRKILTVSYGTFSCTLEGFEDAFGAMTLIAEYFRDLSARDRHFGAEPAPPDPQVLAALAARGLSVPIERQDVPGGVVLREAGPETPEDEGEAEAETPPPVTGDFEEILLFAPEAGSVTGPETEPAAEEPPLKTPVWSRAPADPPPRPRAEAPPAPQPSAPPQPAAPAPQEEEAGTDRPPQEQMLAPPRLNLSPWPQDPPQDEEDEEDDPEAASVAEDPDAGLSLLERLARAEAADAITWSEDFLPRASPPPPAPGEASELERELAALSAEIRAEGMQLPGLLRAMPGPPPAPDTRTEEASAPPVAATDPELERLLRETDEHHEEDAATQRRATLAALRQAADAGAPDAPAEDVSGPYRDDLKQAVRQAPPPPQAAPLKLVAEQRVPEDRTQAPEDDDVPLGTLSFPDYAAEVGAHDMAALIQAAACYLNLVLKRDSFSRPQLMGRVRQVLTEDFDREEGLRLFGTLVRDGQIRRHGTGLFSISSSTLFRPEGPAASRAGS